MINIDVNYFNILIGIILLLLIINIICCIIYWNKNYCKTTRNQIGKKHKFNIIPQTDQTDADY